jgi:hypothetical protein
MIIRTTGDSLLLVTQADHARLASELMHAWREGGLAEHPRRAAILAAARDHDNGWIEEDEQMHVDASGEPLDFIAVPVPVKHRIWPRAAKRLADEDPYVAALVVQHALTIHGQQRGDAAWQRFFATMDALRADLVAASGPGAGRTLEPDYAFLQTADQLSLIFCNGWRTPFARLGGRTILRGGRLEISPDPFAGGRVRLQVPARRLFAQPYASARELQAAYAAAPVTTLDGEAVGCDDLGPL